MRFKVLTLGCKVNQYESRSLEEELSKTGALPAVANEPADLIVINTCTVTARSDVDARALIRREKRENPGARVVVAGCYAALQPDEALEVGADLVHASADKAGLVALALSDACGVNRPTAISKVLLPEPVRRFSGRKRAFFKVQDGCECFCAYCVVPFARGPSRSLPLAEVEAGIGRLVAAGHREVVLTGIHLGLWGRDLTPPLDVCDLLEVAENSGINRVRLSSIEPLEVTDALLSRMARSEKVCPHLHIPLQSGADPVLRAMGRPYTVAQARERILAALETLDGVCIGFDVITGFPGETEEDFAQTLEFLERLAFCHLHVFRFSPRRGTRAYHMAGQVDKEVSASRAARLRSLSNAKRAAFYGASVGRAGRALAEGFASPGVLKGHTANYLEVEFPWEGELPAGEIVVDLVGWDGKKLIGRVRHQS